MNNSREKKIGKQNYTTDGKLEIKRKRYQV